MPADCAYLFGAQKLTKCQLLLNQLNVTLKAYLADYKPLDTNMEQRLPGYKSKDTVIKQQLQAFSNYLNDCDMYFSNKLREINQSVGIIGV